MKKFVVTLSMITLLYSVAFAEEKKGSVNAGADIVSSYLWRGTKFGNGAAFQPVLEYSRGGFSLGAWGSYGFADAQFSEADLYVSYGFDFGLSMGFTGYYFPETSFFNNSNHAWEFNAGFEKSIFSLSANYMLNEGAGSAGGDMYIEAGLATGPVNWFIGAGDGWHTPDGKFSVCNIGVSGSREIKLTDAYSLPVFTTVILNPKTEQFHIVFGITL
jgi:hypothetical protein